MSTVKSIPEGVQAVFPMLVCRNPAAEMSFCADAFGAVEQVRRPGPDGSAIHIAMRIHGAFLVVQAEFPDAVASRAPASDGSSPVVIFVYVPDVDQAVDRAVAAGARVATLPSSGLRRSNVAPLPACVRSPLMSIEMVFMSCLL